MKRHSWCVAATGYCNGTHFDVSGVDQVILGAAKHERLAPDDSVLPIYAHVFYVYTSQNDQRGMRSQPEVPHNKSSINDLQV